MTRDQEVARADKAIRALLRMAHAKLMRSGLKRTEAKALLLSLCREALADLR
jgi:hypothetical protein